MPVNQGKNKKLTNFVPIDQRICLYFNLLYYYIINPYFLTIVSI